MEHIVDAIGNVTDKIVRCEDCRHSELLDTDTGTMVCTLRDNMWHVVTFDGFCNMGEEVG